MENLSIFFIIFLESIKTSRIVDFGHQVETDINFAAMVVDNILLLNIWIRKEQKTQTRLFFCLERQFWKENLCAWINNLLGPNQYFKNEKQLGYNFTCLIWMHKRVLHFRPYGHGFWKLFPRNDFICAECKLTPNHSPLQNNFFF